jgi:hypothetical protein
MTAPMDGLFLFLPNNENLGSLAYVCKSGFTMSYHG